MGQSTAVGQFLQRNNRELKKDKKAKRLFSLKQVAAQLMKGCIPEFKGCSIETILEECLNNDPPDAPAGHSLKSGKQKAATEYVTCLNPEKILPGETDAVRLDVLFEANLPRNSRRKGKMLIGIEIQNEIRDVENLIDRGIFYLSVMISSQYGERFRYPDYRELESVCSIWVCPSAPEKLANTILNVENVGRVIYGDNREGPLEELTRGITGQLIVINLNGDHQPPCDIRGFLWTLLNQKMTVDRKMKIMEEIYGMKSTTEIHRSVKDYDHWIYDWYGRKNFQQDMEKKYNEGRAEGEAEGWTKGREEGEKEGRHQQVLRTARKMVLLGRSDAEIMELLELTQTEIHDIRSDVISAPHLSSKCETKPPRSEINTTTFP